MDILYVTKEIKLLFMQSKKFTNEDELNNFYKEIAAESKNIELCKAYNLYYEELCSQFTRIKESLVAEGLMIDLTTPSIECNSLNQLDITRMGDIIDNNKSLYQLWIKIIERTDAYIFASKILTQVEKNKIEIYENCLNTHSMSELETSLDAIHTGYFFKYHRLDEKICKDLILKAEFDNNLKENMKQQLNSVRFNCENLSKEDQNRLLYSLVSHLQDDNNVSDMIISILKGRKYPIIEDNPSKEIKELLLTPIGWNVLVNYTDIREITNITSIPTIHSLNNEDTVTVRDIATNEVEFVNFRKILFLNEPQYGYTHDPELYYKIIKIYHDIIHGRLTLNNGEEKLKKLLK